MQAARELLGDESKRAGISSGVKKSKDQPWTHRHGYRWEFI